MTFLSPEDYEKIDHLRGEIEDRKRRRDEYVAQHESAQADDTVVQMDADIVRLQQELRHLEQ